MMTYKEFAEKHNLTLQVEPVERNPYIPDMPSGADHWLCTIKNNRTQMTLFFSKGSAHHGAPPTIEEILSCLAMDAASVDNACNFEHWAEELGYDPDSRKAERIYRTTQAQKEDLEALLGDDVFEELLYETQE